MKTLIIVDPQNDFCKNGSLEVKEGDKIMKIINKISYKYDLVIVTKDFHPKNHKSFASQHEGKKPFDVIDLNGISQVLWPDHCVQNSLGTEIHPDLNLNLSNLYFFKKGTNPEIDSYSGFYENDHKTSTGLTEFLKEKGVDKVDICGLALDYCVKFTALDAVKDGFKTTVLIDACRAIIDDIDPVLDELEENGVFLNVTDKV